MNKRDVS